MARNQKATMIQKEEWLLKKVFDQNELLLRARYRGSVRSFFKVVFHQIHAHIERVRTSEQITGRVMQEKFTHTLYL